MKLKIKVKVLTEGCLPEISPKGDWIDLRAAENMSFEAPQSGVLKTRTEGDERISRRDVTLKAYKIPLGIAVKLPNGFVAEVTSRSSGPSSLGLFTPNGIGNIDNSYQGNSDEWHYICSPMKRTSIHKGDRVCQFRIMLSQEATFFQKLKWLFSSGIEIVQVSNLSDNSRGGFGSTGVK